MTNRILDLEVKVNNLENKCLQYETRILFLEEQLSQILSKLISPKSSYHQSLKDNPVPHSNHRTTSKENHEKNLISSEGTPNSDTGSRHPKYKFPGVMKSKYNRNPLKSSGNEKTLEDNIVDIDQGIKNQILKGGMQKDDSCEDNKGQKKNIYRLYGT